MSLVTGLLEGQQLRVPTAAAIVAILREHPLIKLKETPKRVFVVGSFAKGLARPRGHEEGDSDVDILLEVRAKKGITTEQLEEQYRTRLQRYFMQHGIKGKADEVHPQWDGRRIDLYFTYDADAEARPKHELR